MLSWPLEPGNVLGSASHTLTPLSAPFGYHHESISHHRYGSATSSARRLMAKMVSLYDLQPCVTGAPTFHPAALSCGLTAPHRCVSRARERRGTRREYGADTLSECG